MGPQQYHILQSRHVSDGQGGPLLTEWDLATHAWSNLEYAALGRLPQCGTYGFPQLTATSNTLMLKTSASTVKTSLSGNSWVYGRNTLLRITDDEDEVAW